MGYDYDQPMAPNSSAASVQMISKDSFVNGNSQKSF